MPDYARLRQLISEYGQMCALSAITPQGRGQRLNGVIAEMLGCWGIEAETSIRSAGEIDVVFALAGRWYIVEAKWEKAKADTGQLAKLQKRVRQRLAGTYGIFLSMSGYSLEALADLAHGDRLEILLLDGSHFEAMLGGLVPPEELLRLVHNRASYHAEPYTELAELLRSTRRPVLSFPSQQGTDKLVRASVRGFEARGVLTVADSDQLGIASTSSGRLLVTTQHGVMDVDLIRKTATCAVPVSGCHRNAAKTAAGGVLFARRHGVGLYQDGRIATVAGGLAGNSCIVPNGDTWWVFANGEPQGKAKASVTRIGASLGEGNTLAIEYPQASAMNCCWLSAAELLLSGPNGLTIINVRTNASRKIGLHQSNPMGLALRTQSEVLTGGDAITLALTNTETGENAEIAQLNLRGSVNEIAVDGAGTVYVAAYTELPEEGGQAMPFAVIQAIIPNEIDTGTYSRQSPLLEDKPTAAHVPPSARTTIGGYGDSSAAISASSERLNGWRHVTFLRNRNFLAALRGERLRPTDVEACPELPGAQRVADRLLASRFATLSGTSGTGKSITAFHAARRLNCEGWKVVELRQPGAATTADVEEFRNLKGPVLAVIDDAQAIGGGVVAECESSIDDTHAVLLVSTHRLETRNDERLSAAQSMRVLHDHCMANIDAIGPLLMQLDNRVRWSEFAETPEQRLELALRTSTEPWLYMFVASGGERRIASALDRAVEDVDAALILALVCMAQLTSRDAGITLAELSLAARRANLRIDLALSFLTIEKLIREDEGRVRAVHIRVAERALQDLGQRELHGIGATVRAWVRAALLDDGIDIQGKFWLFRVFDRIDAFRYRWAGSIVDEEVSESLLHQCLAAAPGRDRGAALNLLWASAWLHPLADGSASVLADSFISWLPELTSEDVSGYRWVLSWFRSQHEAAYERIRGAASAGVVAERLSAAGSRWAATDWTHVIEELSPGWQDGALLAWSEEFENAIDLPLLTQWLSDRDEHSHPFEIYELIDTLACVAPRAATTAIEKCANEICTAMERDLADAASNFSHWVFGTMLLVARLAHAPSIPYTHDEDEGDTHILDNARSDFMDAKEQSLRVLAAAVLATMQRIDWVAATNSLERKKGYQLRNLDLLFGWLAHLSTDITDEIAVVLPATWFLRVIDEAKQEGSTELRPIGPTANLLYHLCWGERGEAVVRGFLETQENRINPFPSVLVRRYPDLAAHWLRKGAHVEVRRPRGSGWHSITADLKALAANDREAATHWLTHMSSAVLDALSEPHKNDLNGVDRFISLADGLDARTLDAVIERIDGESVRETWTARWTDAQDSMLPLLRRVSAAPGAAAALARSLMGEAAAEPRPK